MRSLLLILLSACGEAEGYNMPECRGYLQGVCMAGRPGGGIDPLWAARAFAVAEQIAGVSLEETSNGALFTLEEWPPNGGEYDGYYYFDPRLAVHYNHGLCPRDLKSLSHETLHYLGDNALGIPREGNRDHTDPLWREMMRALDAAYRDPEMCVIGGGT